MSALRDSLHSARDAMVQAVTTASTHINNAASSLSSSTGSTDSAVTDFRSEKVSEGGRSNYAVVFNGTGEVVIRDVGFPRMVTPEGESFQHGVILKVICSAICGSDLHMYRGRTSVQAGDNMVFGHEITGEIVEMGSDVTQFHVGDWVSVPFNIACGRCQNCKERKTNICLNVNHLLPGGAYGYAQMGNWRGGQAQFVVVPFADFNLLSLYTTCPSDPQTQHKHYHSLASKELILQHIVEVATLADILPTAMNAAVQANVGLGSTVYIAGAGPVGLCAAVSSFLLGASRVVIADPNPSRLENAKHIASGQQLLTIDLSQISGGSTDAQNIAAKLEELTGVDTVDCSIDCVGYESCGCGREVDKNVSEQVLNTCFRVTKAGGAVGVPGVYLPEDPKGRDKEYKQGLLPLCFGMAFSKALKIESGQCPVMKYNHDLFKCIMTDRIHLSQILNVQFISLDEAPEAYKKFNEGIPKKYIIDPNGMLSKSNALCTGGYSGTEGRAASRSAGAR